MADIDTIIGQGEGAPDNLTGVAEGGQSGEGQKTDEPFMHTWKTKEDAEKGVQDLLGQVNETRSKADKAASKNEQLTQMVDKLTNAVSGKQTVDDDAAAQKQIEDLAKRFEDGEVTGQEQVELLMNIQRQAETKAEAKVEAGLKELREQMKQSDARLADLDPAYRDNQKDVDAIQEKFGVNRDQAIKINAELNPGPAQPARSPIPGSTGTGMAVGGNGDGVDPAMAKMVAGLAGAATGRLPTDAQVLKVMQKGAK